MNRDMLAAGPATTKENQPSDAFPRTCEGKEGRRAAI